MVTSLLQSIVKNWWVFAVRGVLAICFGVLAFARPDISLAALVALFGAYALVDGLAMLFASPALAGTSSFWWLLVDGLLGVAVGVMTCVYPVATAVSLLYLLGAWMVVGGLVRIGLAFELRKQIDNDALYLLGGILSIIAGTYVFWRPAESALALMWVIGFYACLYGALMIAAGAKLHHVASHLPRPAVES